MNLTRPGKRRMATRFAIAGALAAAPVTLATAEAQATPVATHHDQFGELAALPEATSTAPGPEQIPQPWPDTYLLTVS
ncbi:hypothetical protein ABH922_000992 [Rhodococcus sp. 27YEA15]|uniref:hypothetical protein n=1 Tax=Rhodococcus sp. 27YEA15 TaxID=3156259 RepID=UPI003C7B3EDA